MENFILVGLLCLYFCNCNYLIHLLNNFIYLSNVFYINLRDNYDDWNRLVSFMKTKYDNKYDIYSNSLSIVKKIKVDSFINYITNNMEQKKKNVYLLKYTLKNREYIVQIKTKKTFCPILQAITDESEDVTEEIQKYLGPNYDWHNSEFTPGFFSYKSLTLNYSNGDVKDFGENEVLKIY